MGLAKVAARTLSKTCHKTPKQTRSYRNIPELDSYPPSCEGRTFSADISVVLLRCHGCGYFESAYASEIYPGNNGAALLRNLV